MMSVSQLQNVASMNVVVQRFFNQIWWIVAC